MSIVAGIRALLEKGFTVEQALAAAEAFEGVSSAPTRTARQERNRRYYERKASEKRLNASESDVSDVSASPPDGPPFPQTPIPPLNPPTLSVVKPTQAAPGQAEFAEFWAEYPRREGSNPKTPASQAYHRCRKRGASHEQIMAGARRYARRTADEPKRFIAQAVTWLNQDRWRDEIESEPKRQQSTAIASVEELAKAEKAGLWGNRHGGSLGFASCQLPRDMQREIVVAAHGEERARLKFPRLFDATTVAA